MSQPAKLLQEIAMRDLSTGVQQTDLSLLPALPGVGRASAYGEHEGKLRDCGLFVQAAVTGESGVNRTANPPARGGAG